MVEGGLNEGTRIEKVRITLIIVQESVEAYGYNRALFITALIRPLFV